METKKKQTQQTLTRTPGYASRWDSQMEELLEQYRGREAFSFDVDQDALYRQYKDRYTRQGKLAMEDAQGQAAALTGGYGNSYAQSVGQQTYNQYLEKLGDRVPELYQMALERYDREGEALLDQYDLLAQQEQQDYGRYQDQAELAKYQVQAMLSLGFRPSQSLIDQSGLSEEYVSALLQAAAAAAAAAAQEEAKKSASSGSGRGRRKTSSTTQTVDRSANKGIDDQAGVANTAWKNAVSTLETLYNQGKTDKADAYLNTIKDHMNQEQYVQAMNIWVKHHN